MSVWENSKYFGAHNLVIAVILNKSPLGSGPNYFLIIKVRSNRSLINIGQESNFNWANVGIAEVYVWFDRRMLEVAIILFLIKKYEFFILFTVVFFHFI